MLFRRHEECDGRFRRDVSGEEVVGVVMHRHAGLLWLWQDGRASRCSSDRKHQTVATVVTQLLCSNRASFLLCTTYRHLPPSGTECTATMCVAAMLEVLFSRGEKGSLLRRQTMTIHVVKTARSQQQRQEGWVRGRSSSGRRDGWVRPGFRCFRGLGFGLWVSLHAGLLLLSHDLDSLRAKTI